MAIEFYCPGCGKLMRTPDPTAGRKGRCPHCSTKVQIPMTSIAPKSDSSSALSPLDATPPQTTANQPSVTPDKVPSDSTDPIQFDCGSCQKTLRVPAANAGKKGKCPHCNAVMTIPTISPAAKQPAGAKWKGAPKPAVTSAPIQFTCPGCLKSVRVSGSAAGKQGKCPHCQTVVKIPLVTSTSPTPSPTPGLTPLDDTADLTPLDSTPGLTPIDSTPGLTPIDSTPGLTPLDGTDGLTPLGGAPDPFGGPTDMNAPIKQASQNPFGGASSMQSMQASPYASPVSRPRQAKRSGGSSASGTDNLFVRMLIPVGRSALSIIAGYLGLFSLCCGVLGPFAILFGILAVVDIQKNPNKGGIGRAIFGIVVGVIASIGLVIVILLSGLNRSMQ